MPTFTYSALSSVGQSVSGELFAEHERGALRELKRRGLTPLSLAIAEQASRRLLGWSRRASPDDRIRLVNELAGLLEDGVSLSESIDIASRPPVYRVFGEALSALTRGPRRGGSMPAAFPPNLTGVPLYTYQVTA